MSISLVGKPVSRVDGRQKVIGGARYAAESIYADLAYAVILGSTIAKGTITGIDTSAAEQADGVIGIMTYKNAPRLADTTDIRGVADPKTGQRLMPLQDAKVRFFGMPVALAVARSLEQAQHAAALIKLTYAAEPPLVSFDAALPNARHAGQGETSRGDAEAAFAAAAIKIDQTYDLPRENHQPMEPHATIAEWHGDRLTLHDKTQGVINTQTIVAAHFGLKPEQVEVISPFVGGAFGSALRVWPHTILAAMAAKQYQHAVKLVLTRRQMVTSVGYRPQTRQRIRLGAGQDGKLTALIHEATGETSSFEGYAESVLTSSAFLHGCDNVSTHYHTVALDTGTPTPMRGPGVSTGLYALEAAMDELAYATSIDPIELRLRNEPDQDLSRKLPFSSRATRECYRAGAEAIGWSQRHPSAATTREGRFRIGMGMATATYPSNQDKADVRVVFSPDGSIVIETAASDIGPGTYTSLSQVAADTLGIGLEHITMHLGDSRYPKAPSQGGSRMMATAGSAVQAVCRTARQQLIDIVGPADATEPSRWRRAFLKAKRRSLVVEGGLGPGSKRDGYSCNAFGAIFAEVAVDSDSGEIHVRRLVGAYGLGLVVNTKLTRSQIIGGMMQGIGMALMERTRMDPHSGAPTDGSFADYLVPVCKDAPQIDVIFVPETDPHVNPLGVKGVGEIALCGMAPAIANAVYHATGKRIRSMPILPEKLMV